MRHSAWMSHKTLAVLWHNQIWHKLTITINSYFVVQRQQHPVTFIGLHAGVHLPVSVIYIKETFHIWSIICLFVLIFVTNEFHLGLGSVSGFRFTPIHWEQYYLYHYINIYLYTYTYIYIGICHYDTCTFVRALGQIHEENNTYLMLPLYI